MEVVTRPQDFIIQGMFLEGAVKEFEEVACF